MRDEELIIGVLAMVWGIILWLMRPELLELGREDGRGLRNRKVINALVTAAALALPLAGAAVIIMAWL